MLEKKLIKDERIIEQFLNFLPNLEEGEEIFYMFMARSKYDTTNTLRGESVLKRGSVGQKTHILDQIKRLNTTSESYEFDGKQIPLDSMVFYLKPNPRSVLTSMYHTVASIASNLGLVEKENRLVHYKLKNALEELIEKVDEEAITKDDLLNLNKIFKAKRTKLDKPERLSLTAMQDSVSRRILIDVDIDIKHGQMYFSQLLNHLNGVFKNGEIYGIIETRGGFHVQIELSKLKGKIAGTWLLDLRNAMPEGVEVEMKKDCFLPVPGVMQGGSYPRLLYHNDNGVVKMSSDSWLMIDEKRKVIDPDGWGRTDFNWSFYNELINQEDFEEKMLYSTGLIFNEEKKEK